MTMFRGQSVVATVHTFLQRPIQHRFYGYDVEFSPGRTDVYLRIETLGPMAIPVRLTTVDAAQEREVSTAYEYGLLYGVMAALSLYNLVLFIIIRQREYGLYSLYLLGFIVNSLSYTGQIHTVFTPDLGPYFQDWVDAFLMITYSVAGLHFARYLLNTRQYAPGLNTLTIWVATAIPVAMVVSALFNQLVLTLVLAFILNSGFALLFIILGAKALQAGTPSAGLFVISSVTAAVCIAISTMAVAGLVPYNDFTFKLIEMGMAFEAIFLAVILAQRFRMAQRDKLIAETYARTDPLTRLKNRRGFKEVADQLWQTQVRKNRDVAVVLLDIDHFKSINDAYGHAQGDSVLKKIARCIESTARKGDVAARWGGEEFILFLPETDQQEAAVQAERIRHAIQSEKIGTEKGEMQVTASFGVAGRLLHQKRDAAANDFDLETLIREADNALYMAKGDGRNCVHLAPQNMLNKTMQMGF